MKMPPVKFLLFGIIKKLLGKSKYLRAYIGHPASLETH